jgi:hypothetical protein
MELWHGSQKIIEAPQFGLGKVHNDYGQGFYCTESLDLARGWACSGDADGFANRYELDMADLKVLDLLSPHYSVLHWIALLIEHRSFRKDTAIAVGACKYLHDHFLPDTDACDVIRGWRADDSYFSYARAFVNNTITVEQLRRAMKLGNLGEQTVLKSEPAFKTIHYAGFERAPLALYGPLAKERDEAARAQYRELLAENPFEGIRIVDIVREGMTADGLRL